MKALFVFATLLVACAEKGATDAPVPVTRPVVPSIVDTSIRKVSGQIFVGDQAHPAQDVELWLLDHTTPRLVRVPPAVDGSFSIPLEAFKAGPTYTLHVTRAGVVLADVDISEALDGLQRGFSYEGGQGYDMGALILPLDARGEVDAAAAGVQGRIGGGFSVRATAPESLETYPAPAAITQLSFGSQLYVFDPVALLHSFYRRAVNPALYSQDLAAFSRVGLSAAAADEGALRKVQIFEGGPWLTAARKASADDDPPYGASVLWSGTNFLTSAINSKEFTASAFVGSVLARRSVVLLRVQVGGTAPEAQVPRVLSPVVTVPPRLVSVDLGSGALAALDYAADAPNGLTKAFCRTGDVRLGLDPPLDETGAVIGPAIFDTLAVTVDYYGVAADGKVMPLAPAAGELPAAYEDTVGTDSARSWNPDTRTMTVGLGTADAAVTPHVFSVPSNLFVASLAAGGVFYVRLRVYFRSSTGATASAIAVWIDAAC